MRLSLQTQIFIALLLIMSIFAAILWTNVGQFRQSQQDQQNVLTVRAVSMRADDLARRASLYETEAPRDFESYNRDLKLFYPNLKADLLALQNAVSGLDAIEGHAADVDELRQLHAVFSTGLAEQIGPDDEPRLEWAARFLAANAGPQKRVAEQLEATIQAQAVSSLVSTERLTRMSWVVGVVAILLTMAWFWHRVARRIGVAVSGCQRVAEGEFGSRIEDSSHDEIGDFAEAFNSLSSRTRVVLGVVDKLDQNASSESAFGTVWNESHGYLGHQWQGLFAIDPALSTGELEVAHQSGEVDVGTVGKNYVLSGIVNELGLNAESRSALWPDIRRHTLSTDQSQLLRELSLQELRTVAFVVLCNDDNQPEKLLVFAWRNAAAESAGVASFLSGLSRFLGHILAPVERLA